MNVNIRKLLEAHVAHELRLFKGAGFKRAVAGEVDAFFAWSAGVRLKDVASFK